jgi:hypothetical protein
VARVFSAPRSTLLSALLLAICAGCAPPSWISRAPKFPSGPETWDLPLYEPLTRVGPHLLATVVGNPDPTGAPRTEEVLLYVDSGSSHGALFAQTFARLGVPTRSSHFVTIEDAAGAKHGWTGAVIPELRVGGLTLAGVVASVTDYSAILGADVLAPHGWRLDLDAGTLTLGVEPWPADPDVVNVPLKPFHDHVLADLRIGGEAVPLLLDTGAPITAVDIEVLRRLGLPERPLASRWPLGGAGHKASVTTSFEGPVALGARDLGIRRIFAHPGGLSVGRGMLGNDILYAYTFQVTRAGLGLRPRTADLVASAPGRIARWHELPTCAGVPGCLAADLAASNSPDGVPSVRVRFLALPSRPFRYLFGCLDSAGRLRDSPLWIEIAVRQPTVGTAVDVAVAPEVPLAFRRLWASGCARLALLDANPIVDGARPLPAIAEAHLATDFRRVSFR